MENYLMLLAALSVGFAAGWLAGRLGSASRRYRCKALEEELGAVRGQFAAEKEAMVKNFAREREREQLLHERLNAQLRQNFEQTRSDMERRWGESAAQMKLQFEALSGELLKRRGDELDERSRQGWRQLMEPLQQKMQAFEQAVQQSREKSLENTAKIETSIRHLMERSQEIGREAERLTHALKGDSKVQGDWGEMVLERMLELSGLRRDEEYFVQMSVDAADGEAARLRRPDVVVRLPGGRSVVIDSKVSLTAYAAYMQADDPARQAHLLGEHLASVRRHVDELAAKDYSRVVGGSIGYVLMFVPNEWSYMLAVKNDDTLVAHAYKRHVVIISPTNLIMALQLAYNLWQGERQSRNTEEIFRRATALYEKFCTFSDTFMEMEKLIARLQGKFDEGARQLLNGRGNILKQLEEMRRLGLSPAKSPSPRLLEQSGDE